MNVYDFDNTIYDGESVLDFYLFALKKQPRLISVLPKLCHMLIRYKACKISYDELLLVAEKYAAKVLGMADFSLLVSDFWDKNQKKIKKFYLDRRQSDDVIISASWSFLIEEVCRRLGIKWVIASEIELTTGQIKRLCFKEKKVQFFREQFPEAVIDKFYTDSMNDAPMISIAKRAFLVKGEKVEEINVKNHSY